MVTGRIGVGLMCGAALAVAGAVTAAILELTMEDFHVSGTQIGEVGIGQITHSLDCTFCHSWYDPEVAPYDTWKGSLMANAGRDPLFYAQMTNANQDVANAGYFCMRCHVPLSIPTGHAADPSGESLNLDDMDGVNCHFCHAMVDPIYKPGISPPEDELILKELEDVPEYYGNSMFVLDPSGTRRGPRADADPMHEFIHSPFHKTGEFCGTCHDVGNVAVSLQPDGSYQYNAIGEPTPDENLWMQFPLERTFSEWKLSAFANGGVDMGGLFGGEGVTVVSTCQDCHMPKAAGQACAFGPERPDVAKHDFAGGAAPVLDLIAEYYKDDPEVDLQAIQVAKAKSISMLERASSLELDQQCGALHVRLYNETGHKLPTGHIEGRRVWVNVSMTDAAGNIVHEYGHYDDSEAHLDESSTEVYEMKVGLSDQAADITGLDPGVTVHMALADTIVKDNRIPPRGFDNEAYAQAGAPAVGTTYADGQYWDDSFFAIANDANSATVTVYYQNLPRHYIEALRDGNTTDDWGDILYDLWETTGRGAPIEMASATVDLDAFVPGDIDCNGTVDALDLWALLEDWSQTDSPADLNGDRLVNVRDLLLLLAAW